MSFVPSLFGSKSGSKGGAGMNYSAERANIYNPTSGAQLNQAYSGAQSGISQQQQFLNALSAQNGIGNQAQVFAQQQALANQLQGMSNGQGPNPALAQLAQTTGQNIAAQNALMAGQRGANANAGLIARQAAMQGGNLQQQAVGQASTLSAQQQLAALSALQSQQGMMGNLSGSQVAQQANALTGYNTAQQNEQSQLLNAMNNYNSQNVSMQSNMNNANATIANTTAAGQQAMFGGALKGVASGISSLGSSGGGGGMMGAGMAHGGMVRRFDEGGQSDASNQDETPEAAPPQAPASGLSAGPSFESHFSLMPPVDTVVKAAPISVNANSSAPQSAAGQYVQSQGGTSGQPGSISSSDSGEGAKALFEGMGSAVSAAVNAAGSSSGGGSNGGGDSSGGSSGGGGGGSMASMMPLLAMAAANKGGVIQGEALGSQKKVVPGQAKVKGNSLKNDTIPALLSPKEIVIPRSITMAPNAPERARDFVAKVLARNGMGRGKK